MAGSWKHELVTIFRLGWPNSINQVLTFLPGLVMLHFLGSDADHVGGAGMGFMFSNVVGLSLIIGTGAGAQPLISQAFGAQNLPRCGDLLQRQLAIHAFLVFVLFAVWLSTEQILLTFKQPAEISELAGRFVRWRVAALPALAVKEDLTNFLVVQRVMQFPMLVNLTASILTIGGFAVFIPAFGFIGAPLAITVANIVQALLLWVFAWRVLPDALAWPQWSARTAFSGWDEMLRLALPGGILMLCEWWGWETNLFFAGLLCDGTSGGGCVQLDVFPIVANTMVVAFMPNFGLAQASGAMIGNALGAGDAAAARRISCMALAIAVVIGASLCAALVLLRQHWGSLFSDDEDAVTLTARVLPIVAVYVFLDNLGPGSLVNILRMMSIVALPAAINFVAFYVIGIPFGLYLTFGRPNEQWGIAGLWSGLALGMLVMVCSLGLFLSLVDWQQASDSAVAAAVSTGHGSGGGADSAELKSVVGKGLEKSVADGHCEGVEDTPLRTEENATHE